MFQKLGDLFVQVSAKGVGEVNQGLQSTEAKATAAGKATQFLTNAIMMIGSAVIINGIKNIIKEFVTYTSQIDKANKTTGIATDTLQRLKYAADQEHTSFESLNMGLTMLTRNMASVSSASNESDNAFKQMGISVKNTDGSLRNVEDVFYDVIDAVAGAKNETEASIIAVKLLGKSGADLVPFMRQGRRAIKESGDEAERLGAVLDEITIKQGKAFEDQLTRLNTQLRGLKFVLAQELLPELSAWASIIEDLAGVTKGGIPKLNTHSAVLDGILKGLLATLNPLTMQLTLLKKGFNLLGIGTKDASEGYTNFLSLIEKGNTKLPDNTDKQKALDEALQTAYEIYKDLIPLEEIRLRVGELYLQQTIGQNKEADIALQLKWDQIEAERRFEELRLDAIRLGNKTPFGPPKDLMTETANATDDLTISLFQNAKGFMDWANATTRSIGEVIIKLMAMAGVVKLLDMLGVPMSALLSIGSRIGLFQTPTGDMFAYREGRDFGKLFFGGFIERFNEQIGTTSSQVNQAHRGVNIVVHTGDPSTFVEFVSTLPKGFKSKIHRNLTIEAQQMET